MSEDPIEAIEQVMDCIKEGVAYGNESVIGGWLHNASKEDIIEWISGNIMGRLVNALERTKEALSATSEKWSEHDETYLKSALWHLCNSISNGQSQDFRSDLTEWMKGLKRRINAGEMERNCDRFNTGDVEKDAQDAFDFDAKRMKDMTAQKLKDQVVSLMEKAVHALREAEVYARRVEWLDSCDDGFDSFVERTAEELHEVNTTKLEVEQESDYD